MERRAGVRGAGTALARQGRVAVREPRASDEREFLLRVRESRGLHAAWTAPARTPEAYARYLARAADDDVQAYLLVRREDGAIVGMATLSHIAYGPLRSAYLGFSAFAPFAGQGYMAEGLEAVLRHAFRALRLHRVEANVQPANAPSLALVARLGFRREGFSPRYLKVAGRWRDHERWALLADDWAERRRAERVRA